jgi:site-specific recombinase XerD
MGLAKLVFWKYQKNKSEESPIFIRVIEDRKPRYIKTGFNAREIDWDFKENCFKTKYRKSEELHKIKEHQRNNLILRKKLDEANDLIKGLIEDDTVISSEQVKQEIIRSKNIGKHSILRYIETLIEEKKKLGKYGTAKCYNDLNNSLMAFMLNQNKSEISFKEITPAFLKKYEESFWAKGATGNGISFYMRSLRAVINRATKDKICKKEHYPFNDYNIASLSTETVKRAISKDDIDKVARFEVESNSQMFRSKNLFLFSYYCRGINFVDMANLKWNNINGNRMTYFRQKTGKYFDIELLKPAINILSHYKECFYKGENSYIFPILDENKHKSQVSVRNRLHKVLGQTNKDLKVLGERHGIKTKLTTYVARHTFATVLRKSGASYSTIKDSMGHSDEHTTQIYIDSIYNEELDKACEALL